LAVVVAVGSVGLMLLLVAAPVAAVAAGRDTRILPFALLT